MTHRQQHVLIGFYFTKAFKILSDMPFKLKGEPRSFVYYKYSKHWLYALAVTNDCKLQIFTTILRSCTTSKGQLILKCPYEKLVCPKIATKLFLDFCPDFFAASWGLPGSFFGLPVGFLIHDITN